MESLDKTTVIAILQRLKDVMNGKAEYLGELDGRMGDGDLGITMSKGFSAAYDELAETEETDLGKIFMKAGMAIASKAPSTMGTLMGTGFMRGGKAVRGKTALTAEDLALFFGDFVQGLMERGKAKHGDKTVIDALHPAAEALRENAEQGLGPALAAAKNAADEGLKATKEMVAEHGRIAYYKEKSRGQEDPGAAVGVMVVGVFLDIAT